MSNKLLLCAPEDYDVTNQNIHFSFIMALLLPDNITQIDKLVFSHCHAALLSVGQVRALLPTLLSCLDMVLSKSVLLIYELWNRQPHLTSLSSDTDYFHHCHFHPCH